MKLLYIHQYFRFPDQSGGTRSYDLSKQFVAQGIDVTMITTSSAIDKSICKKRWTYIEREGIKFWILRSEYSHKMSIPRRIVGFFEFVWFTTFKAISIRTDLVLATSTPLTVAIPAIVKKWVSKTPFIFEVRDVWPEGPIQQGYVKNRLLIHILRKIERFIYHQAAYVVALSEGMKKDILSRVDVKNLEVIPNISELERFQDLSFPVDLGIDLAGKKMILYAGTLGPVNDIMYVAKIADRIYSLDPTIVFVIIGDGKQKAKIVDYCRSIGILGVNIFFLDSIPKKSLPYVYSLATMGSSFVWDYKIKWDNSANKVFDTFAAGRPLLINYQGWQADLIKKEQCGFVLSPIPDKEELTRFIVYLSDHKKLIEQRSNAKRVATYFSLPVAVDKYMKVINSINRKKYE